MAAFDPITIRILLNQGRAFTKSEVARIPAHADVTMSFSHEYIHFIQSVSSVAGFRLLGELIDFGIHAALVLSGSASGSGGTVAGYRRILPLLKTQPDHAGQGHKDIRERATGIMDEARALMMEGEYPYTGGKGPWEEWH